MAKCQQCIYYLTCHGIYYQIGLQHTQMFKIYEIMQMIGHNVHYTTDKPDTNLFPESTLYRNLHCIGRIYRKLIISPDRNTKSHLLNLSPIHPSIPHSISHSKLASQPACLTTNRVTLSSDNLHACIQPIPQPGYRKN